MNDQSRQMRYLILIAAVLCAVLVGYNAFYVPDASLSEPAVSVDSPSSAPSEEYAPSSISPAASGVLPGAASSGSPAGSRLSSSPSGKAEAVETGGGRLTGGKIDINAATAQELSDGLTGIGETLAKRIVAYREQHGPFKSVDELKNVEGIGDKKFNDIRGSVTVG